MESRRLFIKNVGISIAGTALLADPFIKTLANICEIPLEDVIKQFSHTCEIIRSEDLLNFRCYFVNLKLSGSVLGKEKENDESYMIVRLPQQHIAEEVQKFGFTTNCEIKFPENATANFSEAFISGFSFLSFKLKKNEKSIRYERDSILNWNNFDLLTVEDLNSYPKNIPVRLVVNNSQYPANLANFPIELVIANIGNVIVPLSVIEAPYKMFLSPVAPFLRPEKDTDYRYKFLKDNTANNYYPLTCENKTYKLTELWSNDLVYQITHPQKGVYNLPPNFKIVAYNDEADSGVFLLPKADDKRNLAKLTNIQEFNRDIESRYFNLSSLGTSTFLNYFNLDEKNLEVVGWKQDIKLGKDNYVEIIKKGIDARSTLKVLVSEIAERRIEKGKSPLIYREYFKYIEKEKIFAEPQKFNNFLFKKITALSDGAFFKADGSFGDVNTYFIPNDECGGVEILKMPYRGTDINGIEIDFHMDMMIIRKFVNQSGTSSEPTLFYTQDKVKKALRELNDRINSFKSQGKDDHIIKINGTKINYAPKISDDNEDPSNQQKNGNLLTDELQFYSVYNDQYESEYPLIPNLKYALVKIPQLEGIQTVPQSYPVGFCGSYIADGFGTANKTKVFLQVLHPDVTTSYKPLLANSADAINDIIKDQKTNATSIKNVFTDNYKNAGSLVNPDIVINNLSVLKQGISLTDDLNNRASEMGNAVNNLSNVRPADIMRGLNCEILGGINLIKILKNVIPLNDSPLLQVIDQAQEGLAVINQYKAEFDTLKRQYQNTLETIKKLERQVKNTFNTKLKTYVDNYNDATAKLRLLDFKLGTIAGQLIYQRIRHQEKEWGKSLIQQIGLLNNTSLKSISDKTVVFFKPDGNNVKNIQKIIAIKQILDALQAKIDNLKVQASLVNLGLKTAVTVGSDAKMLQELINLKNLIQRKIIDDNIIEKLEADIKTGMIIYFIDIKNELADNHPVYKSLIQYHLYDSIMIQELHLDSFLGNFSNDSNNLAILNNAGLSIKSGGLYTLQDNIDGFFDTLNNIDNELKQTSESAYKLVIDGYNEVIANSKGFIDSEKLKIQKQLEILQRQVSFEVKTQIDAIWNRSVLKSEAYSSVKDLYYYYQSLYLEFSNIKKQALEFSQVYAVDLKEFIIKYDATLIKINADIKEILDKDLITCLDAPRFAAIRNDLMDLNIRLGKEEFKNAVKQAVFENTDAYALGFNSIEEEVSKQIKSSFAIVDAEKEKILEEIEAAKKQLRDLEARVKDFIKSKLKELEDDLTQKNKELVDAYNDDAQVVAQVKKDIDTLQGFIKQLRAIDKKEMRYTWRTTNFDDVNLGILKFIKGKQSPTELKIDVLNTINFDVTTLPPRVKSITNSTNTKLSNFSINFLEIITIAFDNVSFVAGTGIGQKFDVAVRDVNFDGPLNFVQVFQSYLKTLDKGLRFDLTAEGAVLGYELTLPDITGGAFNFVNWKLIMDLRLPFKAGVPMRFNFGLNTPQDMGLVTGTIWGGRGCFIIGLEPKRGVVYILLIIEVGVVLYLNIGVASGIVYIFAGIYIKKEYDKVELRGYLTCGGVLDILHLISASVTFYMGLRGNGHYLEGYCTLTYKIKITPFVKIKVRLSMYKMIQGCPDNSQRNDEVDKQSLQFLNRNPALFTKEDQEREDELVEQRKKNKDIRGRDKICNADWNDFFEANYTIK